MHQLASGLRGEEEDWRGGGWLFMVRYCSTERDFGMEAQTERERIGQSNGAKIPHSTWPMIKRCVSLVVGGCVAAETVVNTSCPLLV